MDENKSSTARVDFDNKKLLQRIASRLYLIDGQKRTDNDVIGFMASHLEEYDEEKLRKILKATSRQVAK